MNTMSPSRRTMSSGWNGGGSPGRSRSGMRVPRPHQRQQDVLLALLEDLLGEEVSVADGLLRLDQRQALDLDRRDFGQEQRAVGLDGDREAGGRRQVAGFGVADRQRLVPFTED